MRIRVVKALLRAAVLLLLAAGMPANLLAGDGPMPPPPWQSVPSSR
jgi:hypothetical protein